MADVRLYDDGFAARTPDRVHHTLRRARVSDIVHAHPVSALGAEQRRRRTDPPARPGDDEHTVHQSVKTTVMVSPLIVPTADVTDVLPEYVFPAVSAAVILTVA